MQQLDLTDWTLTDRFHLSTRSLPLQKTYTSLNMSAHELSRPNNISFDSQMVLQKNALLRIMCHHLIMHTVIDSSTMGNTRILPLSREMTVPFLSGIIEPQNLLGSPITLPVSVGYREGCGPRALSCRFDNTPRPLRGTPRSASSAWSCHSVRKMCRKAFMNVCPRERYHVFHQTRFTSPQPAEYA